jgi:hypothetical protein
MSEMTLAKNPLISEPDLSDISSKKFETVTSNYGICFGVVSADASHFYFSASRVRLSDKRGFPGDFLICNVFT